MINETMKWEIHLQPEIIKMALPQLREQLQGMNLTPARVLAGGCGDSYFAALASRGTFATRGMPFVAATAQELTSYTTFGGHDLVALTSISGNTKRTVEAAHVSHKNGSKTLGITCNADSSLAEACDATLVLPYSPISRRTPHTLDYSVNLLALACLAERLSGETISSLADLPRLLSATINTIRGATRHLAQGVREDTKFFFLGAGPQRGTAMYGAAKFHEAGGLTAFHEETENFVHGMNFMLEPKDVVMLLAPTDSASWRANELVPGLEELSVKVAGVSDTDLGTERPMLLPKASADLLPFLSCLAPQLFCLEVAEELKLRLEDDRAGRDGGAVHLAVQGRWMKNTRP